MPPQTTCERMGSQLGDKLTLFVHLATVRFSSIFGFNMAIAEGFIKSLLAAAGGYALYLIGLVIYRLYFHPLAKFPGPKYAAISHWHEVYYDVALKGQFTFKVQDLHKQYG